jgi:hypothetical protein
MIIFRICALFITFAIINSYGSIEENFAGGGISIEGKGNIHFRQYDIDRGWDRSSTYIQLGSGIGYFPKDRIELFINPIFETSLRYNNDEGWSALTDGYLDIGIKYAFLLNTKESNGFVFIPGLAIGNYFGGYGYDFEYCISFCTLLRFAYFMTSRFACFISLEPRYILRTIEPHGIDIALYFGAGYYFPRFMKILFKTNKQ